VLHRDDRTPSQRTAVCAPVSPVHGRGRPRAGRPGRGSRRIGWLAAVAALAVISVPSTASAEPAGLWASSFQADPPSSCGPFFFDGRFCYTANDGVGAVELGVKFSSTKSVDIVGVRVYRTDAGSVTGSLWSSDGTRLRSAPFTSNGGAHGWQDTLFAPVSIEPGNTYIASYHAPNADYAFHYYYFTNSAYSAGPMVASQSVQGDGNGVFCYDGASCSFPTGTYQDSNYWVTPLWAYRFTGFAQPIDNGDVWNTVKAGSAIPVKFSLGGAQGLDVIDAGSPTATETTCPNTSTTLDAVEETVTASQSGLTYDEIADQYIYVWKTNKAWAGRCYRFDLGLNDQSSRTFNVEFLK
jgi:Domain of unknown function (DUF4082)